MNIYFKYNNDNNPFMEARFTADTYFTGLSKIGGYITLIAVLKTVLAMYNKRQFEKRLC